MGGKRHAFSGCQWWIPWRNHWTSLEPGSTSNSSRLSMIFWSYQIIVYPLIAKKALEILILFVTMYLCKQSFSRIEDMKTKKRKRLCYKNDTRVALAKVKLHISELVSEKQHQKSHWFAVNIHYVFVMFCWSCSLSRVILCATDVWFICAIITYIRMFWRNHFLFFQ